MSTTIKQAYYEHTSLEGERWDQIAWQYYRNVDLQSELLKANRHLWLGLPIKPIPAILPAGLVLRVPVLNEERDDSQLPPWKRGAPTPETAVSEAPPEVVAGSIQS